jgi:hypothetical protein
MVQLSKTKGDIFMTATLATIFPLLISVAPIVFVMWFLIKIIKIQQEKNIILKSISDKLDKLKNN